MALTTVGVLFDEFLKTGRVVQRAGGVDVVVRTVLDEDAGHRKPVREARRVLSPVAQSDRFLKRGCAALAVPLDGQLVVDANAVLDQELGALNVAATGCPVHEREVIGPADVRLQHRDARCVRRARLEDGLEGIAHTPPHDASCRTL